MIETLIILIVIVALHVVWAKRRIAQWAKDNNYTVTKCKLCLFGIGPFSYFGTSGGQYIFRIEAMSSEGKVRSGYARAGGFFFGLLRSRVEVKWDRNILDEQTT